MGMHLSNTDFLQTTRPNKTREFWNTNFVKLVNSKHPYFPKLIEKFKDGKKAEILLEKTCVEQKRARPKKKLNIKNSHQPNDILRILGA